jgi:hypothetical protein
MKKDEIRSFSGKRMELEIFMLREISQTQKDISCFLSYAETRLKKKNMKSTWGTTWEEKGYQ